MEHPRPILNYSSPAEEHRREQEREAERREAIELYNESTFGERRPIASAFLRIVAMSALVALTLWVFPRGVGRALAWVIVLVFVVWQVRRDGWPPPRYLK